MAIFFPSIKNIEELVIEQIVVLSLVLFSQFFVLRVLDLVTDLHDHEQCLLVFSSTARARGFDVEFLKA